MIIKNDSNDDTTIRTAISSYSLQLPHYADAAFVRLITTASLHFVPFDRRLINCNDGWYCSTVYTVYIIYIVSIIATVSLRSTVTP